MAVMEFMNMKGIPSQKHEKILYLAPIAYVTTSVNIPKYVRG
jgi:hypothetical protein